MSVHAGAQEAVEEILDGGGDADDVLRNVVAVLHERLGRFVRISFVEADRVVAGPSAGEAAETTAFPIVFQGSRVADLEAAGDLDDADRALLEHTAILISPYALVGWDTGGEEWTP